MKDFIKNMLHEALAVPSYKMPKVVNISPGTLNTLKSVNWSDITIDNTGDDGVSTLYMDVKINTQVPMSEGIVFTIQLLHDTYYQPHLFLAANLQGIGLGPKILKSFIMGYGHIYAGNGRTVNQDANKMLGKLTTDSDLETYRDSSGLLIIKKGNPDKEKLLRIIQN